MLTFPAKFAAENAKGQNDPAYLVKLLKSEVFIESTAQADWAANTLESQVDYTPTPPDAGDVILTGGIYAGGAWTQKTTGAISARQEASSVFYNGKMYVFGGFDSGGSYENDIWEYDIAGDSWAQKTPTGGPPAIRCSHTAVVYNGKMYIFGGYTGSPASRKNDIWEYDIAGNSWTQKTSGATGRNGHTAIVYNGEMYIFGGYNASAAILNDVWKYNIAGDSWVQKTSGASIRAFHTAIVTDDCRMYVF